MIRSLAASATISLPLLFASQTHAADFRDWETLESSCIARTSARTKAGETYTLNVSVDKTGARPVEIGVRAEDARGTSAKILKADIQINKQPAGPYYFVKMPRGNASREMFWNVPLNTTGFLSALRESPTITVTAIGGGSVTFSMAGSTKALQALESACGKANFALTASFENAFVSTADVKALKAAGLTSETGASLREIVAKALSAYRGVEQAKSELANVEDRFRAMTTEANQLQALREQLAEQLKNAGEERETSQTGFDQANGDLAKAKQDVTEAKARLSTAISSYETAYNELRKSSAAVDEKFTALQNEKTKLRAVQAKGLKTEQSIATNESQMSQLNAEVDGLNEELSSVREDLEHSRLRSTYADDEAKAYNASLEISRKRDAHPTLKSLESEIAALRESVAIAKSALQSAQSDRNEKVDAVRRCDQASRRRTGSLERSTIWAALLMRESVAAPAPKRGGDIPNNPKPKPAPAPTPSKNPSLEPDELPPPPPPVSNDPKPAPLPCAEEREALAAVDQTIAKAQGEFNSKQNALAAKVSARDQITQAIDKEVNARQTALNQKSSEAKARVADLDKKDKALAAKIKTMTGSDRARLETEAASLRTQYAAVKTEIANSQASIATLTAAYNDLKQKTGFDTLKTRVETAQKEMTTARTDIANGERKGKEAQDKLVALNTSRNEAAAKIDSLKQLIAMKDIRAGQLQEALKPYNTSRAAALKKLAIAEQGVAQQQILFLSQLPK